MVTLQISLGEDIQQLNQVIDDLEGKRARISILGRALTEDEQEVLARIERALPLLRDALTQLQS
jgi:aspartate aminotransferase-like enzyme